MKNKVVFNLVLSGILMGLLVVSSIIRIPLGTISITFQTLVIFVIALLLGYKWGSLTILCYLIVGLLGLPVFSKGGGFHYVLEPSFGYLVSFLIATFVVGKLVEKNTTYKRMIIACFIGLAIIYAIGLVYLYIIMKYYLQLTIEGFNFFVVYCLIPLPMDIISIFIAVIIVKRLKIAFNNLQTENQ